MNEHQQSEYRSPKAAAYSAANELHNQRSINQPALEASSPFSPERHAPYPRAIELKAPRFAYTAVFIDQVAEKTLVGQGTDSRLPQLQALRDRQSFLYTDDDPLGKLMDDWYSMDFSDVVTEVLSDSANREYLEEYQTIVEDIATDPDAEASYMHTESAFEELTSRINPAKSFETEIGGYLLIRWSLALMPTEEYPTAESRRMGILQSIPFLEELGRLEIEHASQYFHNDWASGLHVISPEEAGVEWRKDADGIARLRLKERKKRPEKTMGQPVGCPAGFTFESTEPQLAEQPSAMARFLAAYVNEAYDRGLFA